MAKTTPRVFANLQCIHFIRKGTTFADAGTATTFGTIPAGSVVFKPLTGVNVDTGFAGGNAATVNIGTAASGALYASALSLTATTFAVAAASNPFYVTADTDVTFTVTTSGNTVGSCEIILCYIPNIDG